MNYVKKISAGGSTYYIKDVEAKTVPILGSTPTTSTKTWSDSDGTHNFYIGSRCRVAVNINGVSTYKFYLLCNIDNSGNYIWAENNGTIEIIYSTPSVTIGNVPDVSAGGSTVTCPVPTYSQTRTIKYNGQISTSTLTSGGTITYGTTSNPTSTSRATITGNSLGTTTKARTQIGTFHVKVTMNGKSGTGSKAVYQQANAVTSVSTPSLSCGAFTAVEPLKDQTTSRTVSGTCKRVYTSGSTSGAVTGSVNVTSVSSNNGNFTVTKSGAGVTVRSASNNTNTSATKTSTITITGTVSLDGHTTGTTTCTATATQKKDYTTTITYGTPTLGGTFSYAQFSDLGETKTPYSNPTYSQSRTQNYKSGNTAALSALTSGGTFKYGMTAATGFTLNSTSTGSITVAENPSTSARSTTASVTVTMNGKTSSSKTCTVTQAAGSPYKAVNLGLPSGTLWCTCNVGANSETEYGEYFSWGDIRGQNKGKKTNDTGVYSFSEANYNAGKCGKGHTLTGDIPQGNATYDAARANMGSLWKMPTKNQCQELINNTTSIWTSINSVRGRKLTSKTDSSKYIFIPAAGFWRNTNLGYTDDGFYWTATIAAEPRYPSAIDMYDNQGYESLRIGVRFCYYGESVRAIQ